MVAAIAWPGLMEEQRANAQLFVPVLAVGCVDVNEEVRLELVRAEDPVFKPLRVFRFNALFKVIQRCSTADVK